MYSVDQIKKGVQNPRKIQREFDRKQENMANWFGKKKNSWYGINYLEQEWDNLIILDGCRFDLFQEHYDRNVDHRISNASSTPEFLDKNFDGKVFDDLVYASANPHLDHISAEFSDIFRLWETDWDDSIGTVLPGKMTKRLIQRQNRYSNKRLVAHYIQPHRPFLGQAATKFRQSELVGDGVIRDSPTVDFWWNRLERGDIERDLVWKAYAETLEHTLPHIHELVEELEGITVLTADHGNAFGEEGVYGHPAYTHCKSLIKIPWLRVESGEKKNHPSIHNDTYTRYRT